MKKDKLYTDQQIEEILALVDQQEGEQIPVIPQSNWCDDGLNRLYGATITDIRISKGEEYLTFVTDKGLISFEGWSDCCSETWFADFFGIPFILGSEVFSVESIDLEVGDYNVESDERTRQDCDEVYGYRIKTKRGVGIFSLRNSSNGWYGGSIHNSDRHITDESCSIISQRNWMAQ